jgi:hypothetical protein
MSMIDPTGATRSVVPPSRYESAFADEINTSAWVDFAAIMLGMVAVLNFIDGLAAVSNSSFFVGNAKYVFSDLHTWGWILMGIAVIQAVTAIGVVAGWKGVRWVGVTIAAVNAIVQLLVMPSYPLWSLCLFALDILVIYGLVAHGARRSA